jgi:hypothetical protein
LEVKTTLRIPDFMKPILEDIRLLRSDGNNPNRMTNKQKDELWKSIHLRHQRKIDKNPV